MKQININDRYLAVDVFPGAFNFRIEDGAVFYDLGDSMSNYAELPPGQYTIVGRQREVGEGVARLIAEYVGLGGGIDAYRNYTASSYRASSYNTALDSLASFCRANGLDNPLILKIDKI